VEQWYISDITEAVETVIALHHMMGGSAAHVVAIQQ
jgi:hypothetical protein